MNQEAILMTKNNAEMAVAELDEYATVEEFLEDYEYMLNTHDIVVFCRDSREGYKSASYVVTIDMFNANNPGIQLNNKTFTLVRTV